MNFQSGEMLSSRKQWLGAAAASSILLHQSLEIPWVSQPDVSDNSEVGARMRDAFLFILGAFIGAVLADIFGRKKVLLSSAIFAVVRMLGFIFQEATWVWIVELFVQIGSGLTCVIVPVYISEIAGTKNRSNLLTLQLLAFGLGMFVAITVFGVLAYSESEIPGDIFDGVALAITVVFSVVTVSFYPETPYYLNAKQRYQEAAESVAFLTGIRHGPIRAENVTSGQPIRPNTPSNLNLGWCSKIRETMNFSNRRSLAIIFTIIVLRWASGQQRNDSVLWYYCINNDVMGVSGSLFTAYGIRVVLMIFIVIAIGIFTRKIPVLLVVFVSLIIGFAGMIPFEGNTWLVIIVFSLQHFVHLILIGVTLVYTGQFFPTATRALAIAIVLSFEVFIRNLFIISNYPIRRALLHFHYTTAVDLYINAVVSAIGLLVMLIVFPRVNKLPNPEMDVETFGEVLYLS